VAVVRADCSLAPQAQDRVETVIPPIGRYNNTEYTHVTGKKDTRMKMHILISGLLTLIIISCNTNDAKYATGATGERANDYNGPIIDMHIHAYRAVNPMFGLENKNPLTGKSYSGSKSLQSHQEETFAKFKKCNIVKAMVSNGSQWYESDTSIVLIGENHSNSVEELRDKYGEGKLDVIGEVAPNYEGILPTDERLAKYFDLANELSIPIAYHMYPGGPPGGAYFAYPKTRAFQGKPLQLEEILFSRPNMKLYIMHAGWPYLEDMKALMYAHPQVYVDLGVISWGIPQKEFHNFLKGLVEAGFEDRIMFGSDQMVWVETIDEAIEAVNSAEFLLLDQKADIFYNNAARFLNLSEKEIKKHKRQ